VDDKGGKGRNTAKIEKTCGRRSFTGMEEAMEHNHSRRILQISQVKGLRGPRYGL